MLNLFEGHFDLVVSVAFSPNGKRATLGSFDRWIRVWDAETGNIVSGPFNRHNAQITFAATGLGTQSRFQPPTVKFQTYLLLRSKAGQAQFRGRQK